MTADRIERATLIEAPPERVWRVITEPEHLGTWFGDAGAEIDLRPGGALVLRWDHGHTVHGVVEDVDPPHRFSYRWLLADGPVAPTPGNSTLVEFTLTPEATGTRLRVIESGFAALDLPAGQIASRLASHTEGWPVELGHLAEHVRAVPA